ncbi:MAG: RnfH family protein [Gammaproteobacteria bacterium]|nr:RnfH family protein [Gammaproteobacteria bacterium]
MANAESGPLGVEVVYAIAARQRLVALTVAPGTTVAEVIEASGILREFPEIDLRVNRVGVFGHLTRLGDVVQAGDRVEIYRPLPADPKEARRQRARRAGKRG